MNRFPEEKNNFSGVILCVALVIGLSMTVACGGGSSASTGPHSSLAITTTSLPAGNVGADYLVSICSTGGTGTGDNWTASAGLPPGLTLATGGGPSCAGPNSTGQLFGTPATKGTFNFSVTVTDSAGASATKTLSVTIGAPLPLVITTTSPLANGQVNFSYGESLQATGGVQPFTWSLAATSGPLPPGLTLNSLGAILGVPTTQGAFNFTVKVTDTTGVSASQMFSITIAAPPPLMITTTSPLPNGTVNALYKPSRFTNGLQLLATGSVQAFTWSLTAASGPLPPGLTMSPLGLISGTPTAFGVFAFTVMVSDAETPPMTATANFSITVNTLLLGQYAFLFNGFDANGAVVAAGSFTADGMDNITGGVEDINRHGQAPAIDVPFTGNYTIGKDNRGTLTLTSSLGTSTFAFAINSSGGQARFIELDTSGTRGSGVIQSGIGGCTLASFKGDFAFGISGDDANKGRVAVAGRFHADGAGILSSGVLDEDDAGTLSSDVAWSGTYSAPAITSPRCTATFTPTGLSNLNFAIYPPFLVEVDSVAAGVPLTAGRVLGQSNGTGFTNATLNAPMVGGLTGFSASSNAPDVSLVFLSPDGFGNATITQDENKGGVVTSGIELTGTYAVNSNGRVTLTNTTGKNLPVLYLVDSSEAFVVGTDNAATFGIVLLQVTGGAAFTPSNATINKSFDLGTDTPASSKVTDLSGVIAFDGVGALTGTSDKSTPASNIASQAFTGTYSVTNSPVNGHGTFTITPTGGSPANFDFIGTFARTCRRFGFAGFTFCSTSVSTVWAIPSDTTQTNPAVLVLEQ